MMDMNPKMSTTTTTTTTRKRRLHILALCMSMTFFKTDAFSSLPSLTRTFSSSTSTTTTSLDVTRNRNDWSEKNTSSSPRNNNNNNNNKRTNRRHSRPRQQQQQQRQQRQNRSPPRRQSETTYDTTKILIPPSQNSNRKYSDVISCPHFSQDCPGCITTSRISNIDIVRSAQLYFASASVKKHLLENDNDDNDDEVLKVIIPSPLDAWRTQAKLAVSSKSKWNKNAGVSLGLYKRASHQVLPIPSCTVHHPSINLAAAALESATAKCRIDAYQEDVGQGSLRYVQFMVERSTNKVSLALVWNSENLKGCQPGLSRLVKELKKEHPKMWHSIWVHCNDNFGNAIFARSPGRWFKMDGMEFVREPLPGTASAAAAADTAADTAEDEEKKEGLLYFTPMTFRQGNMDGFDVIAQHVAREVPGGAKVCEMYAGVGLLGLTALSYHGRNAGEEKEDEEDEEWWGEDEEEETVSKPLKWLRCSDENPANPRCFERSVKSMPTEITGRQPGGFKQSKKNKRKGGKHFKRNGKTNNAAITQDGEMTIEDMMAAMLANEENFGGGGGGGSIDYNYDDDDSYDNDDDIKKKDRITYTVAAAGKAMYDGQALGADVLIVDPPRKGLDEKVLVQLCKPHDPYQDYVENPVMLRDNKRRNMANDVTTLIYVSCGFDALARDTDRLLSADAGWKIKSATGYVLFPGSNHVETVVIFKRKGRRRLDGDW